MTREEATEILKEIIDEGWLISDLEKCIAIDACEMAIEALKQTIWIPVSERLPVLRGIYKISDDVLITDGYEIYMGYLVERTGEIFWHYYGSEYEVGIKDKNNDTTAWMPLPAPYKAEKEMKHECSD